jgi:uncharacterized LabA/DUF88 family protein
MSDGKIEKLAVLIDADNAQPSIVDGLLSEIAKYGTANVKRIYGDWTLSGLKGWKEVLLEYSIQPIQQFGYTSGKNATDSALIIDAMDLLYTAKFDGFCIVSSDSDFTKLASRIREAGLFVYGFGEEKTPKAFVSACDKFIFTEVLRSKDDYSEKKTLLRHLRTILVGLILHPWVVTLPSRHQSLIRETMVTKNWGNLHQQQNYSKSKKELSAMVPQRQFI